MSREYEDYARCPSGETVEGDFDEQRKNEAWTSLGNKRVRVICAGIFGMVFFPMILLSLAQFVQGLLGLSAPLRARNAQTYQKPLNYSYSQSSLTRDIEPKPIHSHNDYWRGVPLYDAISFGCISIEADVWHIDNEKPLYVGHSLSSLSRDFNLNSYYIEPLLDILEEQNPETGFAHDTHNGIFDTDADQTLYFYIDIKTAPDPTYSSLLTHLVPLTPYLSYYNTTSSTFHSGAITVIATGNAPFDLIASSTNSLRYVFYDAPVDELLSSPNDTKYNTTNSLMSSGSFNELIGTVVVDVTEVQRNKIRELVKAAHNRGIGIRFWETPGWPVRRRNQVWRALVEEGVDLLNADDLNSASEGDW